MLSYNQCEKILNKREKKYTKQQIEMIRSFLYSLAEIDKQAFINHQT